MHIVQMRHSERIGLPEWSEGVLEVWQARTPEAAQGADFRTQGPIDVRMKINGQKIDRWLNPDIPARPSIDVEEALVLALPPGYRERCISDLALRYGGFFVQLPAGVDAGLGNAGGLLKEWGEALIALAPLLADNKINANDDTADLIKARAELLDVQAGVQGLLTQINNALDQQKVEAEHAGRVTALRGAR